MRITDNWKILVLSVCILLTGCSGQPIGGQSPTDTKRHPGLTANLEVEISTTQVTQVKIRELGESERGEVYNETYSEVRRIDFGENNVFRENRAYQVTILVGDKKKWAEDIKHYEDYRLEIRTNGSVEVKEHTTA